MSSHKDPSNITRPHVHLGKDTLIGHYRIIEKIGAVGMGEVISMRTPNSIARSPSTYCPTVW